MPKDTSHNLVVSDAKLNELLNDTAFVGSNHELQKQKIKNGDFNFFKVDQLKAMIKFLRSECNRYDLSLCGKKATLVEKLKDAFFSNQSTQGGSSSSTPPKPSISKPRNSFTTLSNPQLKLQSVNEEEQRLLKVFNEDKTLKGRIDPHQQVEKFIYVKVFHQSLAIFSIDFDLSQEEYEKLMSQNYQIHIHYFTHDMVPRNWNPEYPIFFNSIKLDTPTLNRKIAKGIKKEVLIVSTPFIMKGTQSKQGGNRIDIKASPYSTLDGRLVVNFVKILTSDELTQSIVARSTIKHNLDLDIDINKIKYVPVTSTNESIITFDDTSSKTIAPTTEHEKKSIVSLLKIVETEAPINANKNDDMIEELEGCDEIVPLKDPLSLCRIEIPAKGRFCVHKSCFDLNGYLEFGKSSKTYNCPRCDKPLPFAQLIIDPLMQKVLSTVGQDVEKVLVKHDGTFTVWDDAPKKRISTPAKPAIIADIIDDDDEDEFKCSSPPIVSLPPPPLSSLTPTTTSTPIYPPIFLTDPPSLSDISKFFDTYPSIPTPTSTFNNSGNSLLSSQNSGAHTTSSIISNKAVMHPNPTTPQNKNTNTHGNNNGVNSYGLSVDDAIEIDD